MPAFRKETVTSPWFVRPQPRPFARLRLFCFPYAGIGASAYRPWAAELPPEIELCALQPPGRETRLREAALDDLDELVAAVGSEMLPLLDRPFAFFGHSMGACVAYELARRLARQGAPPPVRLFVSGRRAPGVPHTEPPMSTLPDDAFIDEIQRRYNGIPEEVLQYPELVALLLPGLRADITALERHVHQPGEPLDCDLLALGGVGDPRVSPSELEAWRSETAGAFSLRLFPGGHFYLQSARQPLLDTLVGALRSDLRLLEPQPTGA
jgi:medium-chain acyl-[acyl-carrier-protein] hydrolase